MGYELSYDQERDLILGKVEGDLNRVLVEEMSHEFAKLTSSSRCFKLLNDLRSANITPSTFDIYAMPRIVEKQGVPFVSRRAILVSELSEEFEFLETVSVNVGQMVRIFNDEQAALEWLNAGEALPDKPDSGGT